jgi:hypothetical protein
LPEKVTLNLLKQFKKSKVFDKSLSVEYKNFSWSFEKPADYLNQNLCFQKVKSLDEADKFLRSDIFEILKGTIHTFDIDYMAIQSRSFQKPLMEVWGLQFTFDNIFGVLCPKSNPGLFTQQI